MQILNRNEMYIFTLFNLSSKGICTHIKHTTHEPAVHQRFARASLCKIKNITHKQSFFKNAIDNIRYLKYHKDIKNNSSHNHAIKNGNAPEGTTQQPTAYWKEVKKIVRFERIANDENDHTKTTC